MLWNTVYEFFVKYIFGGYFNNQQYLASIGNLFNPSVSNNYAEIYTSTIKVYEVQSITTGNTYAMSLGNYFSLIATIITMVAILLFCVFIIKKIIAIIFRLFTGSSSF